MTLKVFVSVDIEGIAGVVHRDHTSQAAVPEESNSPE